MPTTRRLIGLDWGTTALRAALMDGTGRILDRVATSDGLMAVENGRFEAALDRAIGVWETAGHPPVLVAGMATSRTGWVETPYLPCPAGASELSARLLHRGTPGGRVVHFVPGLTCRLPDGSPDVMRGEETQIAGLGADFTGLVVLPGTHSKWARVEGGRILAFRSMMTGDVFAALRDHTILRLTPGETGRSSDAFEAGVRLGAADGGADLTGKAFRLRAAAVTGEADPAFVVDRLSGLLIGAEIAVGRAMARAGDGAISIVGGAALAQRYAEALAILGLSAEVADPDAAFVGLARIAGAAGVV